MCVLCTLMGILLTFVTEMSGSIWPAVIMHAVSNASPSILSVFMDPDKVGLISWIGIMISLLIVDIVVLIVWRKMGFSDERFFPNAYSDELSDELDS